MNKIFGEFYGGRTGIGLLILRLVMGLGMAQHGYGKIQAPFSWMGPESTIPGILQAAAALSEFGGGLAIAVGLLTPLAAMGIAATMAVAILTAHSQHPWVPKGKGPGFELPLFYLAAAVTLLFTGPGRWSLDSLLWSRIHKVSSQRLGRAAEVDSM